MTTAIFQANFTYSPTVAFAPVRIQFNNLSSVGYPIDNQFTFAVNVSGGGQYIPPNALSTYLVSNIDKYEWDFGDGTISGDTNPLKLYKFSGDYTLKLGIYSQEIFDITTGSFFRIKNVFTTSITISSMTVAWLKQHMTAPLINALETSQGFNDLITASSRMFDRMYKEIADVASLMDVEHVAPKFLEYFSDTLNHQRFYAEKVGYAEQTINAYYQGFLDYSIFDRIKNKTANQEEIAVFRQFLLDTAAMFKQNGSKEAMQNFFKLYGFVVKIKEMWTTNFGTTALPPITENFLLDPTLEKTKSKFMFDGISVTGFDNSMCQFRSGGNNLLLDNYHFLTRHEIFDGIINPNCTTSFNVNDYPPNINKIIRDDGRPLSDVQLCFGSTPNVPCVTAEPANTCTESNITIVPNPEWEIPFDVVSGVKFKIWNAPTGYVDSVVTTIGTITGPDEIDEPFSDAPDMYLWANWNSGVAVPPTVVGVSPLNRPNYTGDLVSVNFSTTLTNDNLIILPGVPTEHDFFVVARGFLQITTPAYYNFSLNIGNTGTNDGTQSVALFSLKHTTPYTQDQVNLFKNVDTFTFLRNGEDTVQTIGTTATGLYNIYSNTGEYGIIEIRQNETTETSLSYNLVPGFYAFELKATYSSLVTKNLILSWNGFNVVEETNSLIINNSIPLTVIPSNAYHTIDPSIDNVQDNNGKGILTIPNILFEGSDMFTVSYSESTGSNDVVSGIVSNNDVFEDLTLRVRFSPVSIPPWQEQNNASSPQRTIMSIFRAINSGNNLYDNYDKYYAVILNGNIGTVSLAEITYSSEIDGSYFRYLDLNPNLTNQDQTVYSNNISGCNGQNLVLEDGTWYDLKVIVKNNLVTVLFRENVQFTDAIINVQTSVPEDFTQFQENDLYQTVINSITLDQPDADTQTFDALGNTIYIATPYQLNKNPGAYGVAVQSSIFKIDLIEIISHDDVDYNLLETEDKWKDIKPKFLDSRNNNLLICNSYDVDGENSISSPTFNIVAATGYDGTVNTFDLPASLGKISANAVNAVIADNVSVTGSGTRYNVWVDSNFINTRFDNIPDMLNGLVVPYGNMFEPFINWSRIEGAESYTKTVQASYTPFINQSAHVLPHTVSMSGSNLQYISQLTRDPNNASILSCDTVLKPFLEATSHSNYLGFWEEVCPFSASPTWTVNGNTFNNQVFQLIYRNNITQDEVIGVKVIDESTMTQLMCRFCQDDLVWGLYDITLPTYAVDEEVVYDVSVSPMTTIRYFIPIGKFDSSNVFMLPPPEILRSNIGTINLVGVYAHHSFTGFELISPSKSTFQINTFNTWESNFNSLIQCNYFLDLQTSFIANFTCYNIELNPNADTPCNPGNELERNIDGSPCALPNTFYMPQEIVNIYNYLQANSIDFTDDFNYWTPKELWIKRKFDVSYPTNNDDNLFSGLNTPNAFFTGTQQLSGVQGTSLTLEDNYPADIGNFIVDLSWCASSVGWDAQFATQNNNTFGVGVFSPSAYALIGFDPSSGLMMGQENLVPLGNFLNAPIPLETVTVSGATSLLFGSYLEDDGGPGKTFIPVGLFNWFLTHANQVDDMSSVQRAGWNLTDFNNEFVQCVQFNGVYGEINQSLYKINNYWAFYKNQIPPFGSNVNITQMVGNCASVDNGNAPFSNTINVALGTSDGLSAFFSVPPLVGPVPEWNAQVTNVYVNNYVLPEDYYSIQNNTVTNTGQLVLNNQLFNFSPFIGNTTFNVSFIFDKLFKLTVQDELIDDFNQNREINWITLVQATDYYQIAKRLPDTQLKFTSDSLPYTLGTYNNSSVYTLTDKFDFVNPSQFSGEVAGEQEVGIISNDGSINVMMLTDVESTNYTIACDVIFDATINNTNYDKNFELILKAENTFLRDGQDWGITNYYHVGIGTYNFDVGLGMTSIDISGNMQDTFLASWGQFNIRSIQSNVFYTLKAEVGNTHIKIYFNERGEEEQLILNYCINKSQQAISDRYLAGEFETLQAIIVGLQNLGITYPDQLGNTVSSSYTFENFKQAFAATLPVNGFYTGFRVFNPLTYVSNVDYVVNTVQQYTCGSAFDGTSYADLLSRINNRFGLPADPVINKVARTLNFSTFIQINDSLFYQFENNDPEVYANPIVTFETLNNKIIVVEKQVPPNSGIGLNDFPVGNNTFIWSLTSNTQNIVTMQDFFNSVPNLDDVSLTRDNVTYTTGLTPSTSGITGSNIILDLGDTITLTIGGDRNVIWALDGTLGLYTTFVRVFEEGFTQEYPILIRDNTFYKDSLQSYMKFADKYIKEIVINEERLNIIFGDN